MQFARTLTMLTGNRRPPTLPEELQNPYLTEESLQEFLALMRRIPSPRILDLGYGTDRLLTFLAKRGFVVTSEDVRETFFVSPPSQSPPAAPRFERESAGFDGIVCVTTFDVLPKALAAPLAEEMQRLLAPGGFALATFLPSEAAAAREKGRSFIPATDGRPLISYHNREIEGIFRGVSICGLTVQKNGLRRILVSKHRSTIA